MDDTQSKSGHSAHVDLWMDCGEHGKVQLSQAADTFVIATNAVSIPPCDARIVITVDGYQFVRPVQLVNGMAAPAREAMLLSQDSVSPF